MSTRCPDPGMMSFLCEMSVLCVLTKMLSDLKIQRVYQTHDWHEPGREINAGAESG